MVKPQSYRRLIKNVISALLVLMVVLVLVGIVSQYRWCFPPDFHSPNFLQGRKAFFTGNYRIAFYSHILCGPFAILIGMFLYWSGSRNFRLKSHRVLGKIQFLLVAVVLAPTGLVMATRAQTGILAGIGFALLAILTLTATILSVVHVRRGELIQHRRWASRLLILLLSPILLRIFSMAFGTIGIESPAAYQFSAWGSWLMPLIAFEARARCRAYKADKRLQPLENMAPLSNSHLEKLHETVV